MEVTISHNVNLRGVKIKDVTALGVAVGELAKEGAKITLDLNAKTFRTYRGQDNTCDGAIIMGSGYHDIGLKKQPDGSYQPVFDPYGFGQDLSVKSGAENFCPLPNTQYDERQAQSMIGKLLQRYGVCVTERAAAQQGKSVQRSTGEKGVVTLTING